MSRTSHVQPAPEAHHKRCAHYLISFGEACTCPQGWPRQFAPLKKGRRNRPAPLDGGKAKEK